MCGIILCSVRVFVRRRVRGNVFGAVVGCCSCLVASVVRGHVLGIALVPGVGVVLGRAVILVSGIVLDIVRALVIVSDLVFGVALILYMVLVLRTVCCSRMCAWY